MPRICSERTPLPTISTARTLSSMPQLTSRRRGLSLRPMRWKVPTNAMSAASPASAPAATKPPKQGDSSVNPRKKSTVSNASR